MESTRFAEIWINMDVDMLTGCDYIICFGKITSV